MNFYYSFLIKLSLLIIIPAGLLSQSEYIKFDRISIEHGLSQSSIYSIMQDRQGFLWFGTQNGLNKYDGNNFIIYKYNPFDSTSLSDNWIQKIIESKDGNLWLGSYSGGLFHYDRDKEKFTNYRNNSNDILSLVNNRIWALYEDSDEFLWIGTSGGFEKFDKKNNRFIHYKKNNNLNIDLAYYSVNEIKEDSSGYLWLGTWGAGLLKFDRKTNTFKNYLNDEQLNNIRIKSIVIDGVFLWIGTVGNGLIKFNTKDESYKIYTPKNGLNDISVLSVIKDKKENIWIGNYDGGLNKLDKNSNKILSYKFDSGNPYSICSNWIQVLYEDDSGIIWIGTGNGISKYVPERQGFVHLQYNPDDKNSLVGDDVRTIYEDKYGHIWIGTWNFGLSRYERSSNKFVSYKNNPASKNSLPSNIVTAIHEDKEGELWIGTSMGFARYLRKSNNFEVYQNSASDSNSLGYNNVSFITSDRYNNLWIGTWHGGLNVYDKKNKKFKRYFNDINNKNSISDNIITCIFEDKDGDIYIGTNAGGINVYNREKDNFTQHQYSFNNRNSISSNSITSIYQDKKGRIWIGTLGGGLNIYDKKNNDFKQITENEGLISNAVYGILEDNNNELWISTIRGLSSINTENFGITNYDTKDGLINLEFTVGTLKCRDGKLYFGGRKGITVIDPEKVSLNIYKAPLIINSFKVFDKELKFEKEISRIDNIYLSYDQNVLSIDYVALNFSRSDRLEYSYILEGFDKEWINAGTRKTAYYTNLSPGKYVFKVKANNGNNVWSESKFPLSITISPPIWKRWWFIVLSVAFIVALGTVIYQYRVNRLLEIERLRTRIASDLHDELASNLSSIAMFSKIIYEEGKNYFSNTSGATHLLERITTLSQESVISIREIIWALDPKPETIHDLLIRSRDMIITSCRAKNIILNCDFPAKEMLPNKNLTPELRKNLWLLLKESLNNSIKHSDCTEMHFITVYDGIIMRIILKDNGKGFDVSGKYSGKGLTTMRKRAEALNTQLEISSAPGEGTTIIFEIKL